MNRLLPLGTAACLAALTAGCSFTATARPVGSPANETGVVSSAGVQVQNARENGPIAGVRLTTITDSDGMRVRNAIFSAGYDFHRGWRPLGLDLVADLGAGGPGYRRYDGVGAYAGAGAVLRCRVWGDLDYEPGFNVVFFYLDLVLANRVGAWVPPEGAATRDAYGEYSLELGLRISLASDVVTSSRQTVHSEPDEKPTTPGPASNGGPK